MKFKVISVSETDLSEGLPFCCYLPDGTPLSEYNEATVDGASDMFKKPQTSSVTGTAIVQELLKYGNQNKVIEIVGTYPSIDSDVNLVTLSGKVMLPKGPKHPLTASRWKACSSNSATDLSSPITSDMASPLTACIPIS